MSIFDKAIADHAFILSAVDFERLEALAAADDLDDAVRTLVRAKLATSTVLFGSDIAPDIVTIGSHVRIAANGRAAQDVIVGTDPRLPPPAGMTVLDLNSALAIALLGCKAGMIVVAPRPDGFVENVRIETVQAQPEAVTAAATDNVVRFAPRPAARPRQELPDDPGPSAA